MNLSAPFIRRPVMTTFLMLALLIGGLFAFNRLSVSDLPNIEYPTIRVSARYPGAAAKTMVNLITIPLEKELSHVKGLKEIQSTSGRGSADISLEFEFNKNLEEASREIQAALNRAERRLPRDMEQKPSYYRQEAGQDHILFLVLTSATASIAEMHDYAELYIERRLARIEGIAHVELFGAPYSLHIRLDPEALAAHKIGLNEVVAALERNSGEIPLGAIKTGTRTLSIETSGTFTTLKELENIIIAPGPIRLKEIASVSDIPEGEEEFHYVTKQSNSLALIIGIRKQSGANTVAISKAVQQAVEEAKKELPPSLDLNIWFDKALWIQESVVDVEWSLLFAFILVVLVIFFSLGKITEALIPSLTLPFSLLITFVVMYLLDFSLDLLSLLALTLSVGFVVDDAIVVLENIVRHREKGACPLEASLQGSREICFTVLSMTLSLIAVFIPLLFMSGINGRLLREFSVTLAIAILASGFISLTLTPLTCSRLLRANLKEGKFQRVIHTINNRMVDHYKVSLLWCLRHPKTLLMATLFCLMVTISFFQSLPINILPEEDRGLLTAVIQVPKWGRENISKVKKLQEKIENIFQSNPYVDTFINIPKSGRHVLLARLIISERPSQKVIIEELQNSLNAIPGVQAMLFGYQVVSLPLDFSEGGRYQYLLKGADLPVVEQTAQKIKIAMKNRPEFSSTEINFKNDEPKLIVEMDENKLQRTGFSIKDVQKFLQNAYTGDSLLTVQQGEKQHKVHLGLDKKFHSGPAALGKLYLKTPEQIMIPLKAFASWKETLSSPTIQRYDQLPGVMVNFSAAPDLPLRQAFAAVEAIAAAMMPTEVHGEWYGAAKNQAGTARETLLLIFAAIVVMYVVLGILYESFIHPLIILSALPFAGLGGVLTLTLFGEPLSLFSMIGFLLLIGIVKKNGIMIVDYALEAQRRELLDPQDAVIQGCITRFRPIMMTTVAAVMGALPIAIGIGAGAETRRGLGLVIVGGLLFSQMLTLYVTPLLYLLCERIKNRIKFTSMKALKY